VSNENRIICREAAVSGFIALMTCDASSEPARQTEPKDPQMSSTSSKKEHFGLDIIEGDIGDVRSVMVVWRLKHHY
jgi:hypothetical protein